MHLPPPINHPARIAERISTLDHLSNGRVEFGTGEGSLGGRTRRLQHRSGRQAVDVGGGPRSRSAAWSRIRSAGSGQHVEMPARNVIPHPLQKPHPRCGWPAPGRRRSTWPPKRPSGLEFRLHRTRTARDRGGHHYWDFEEGSPVTPGDQPQHPAIGGSLSDDGGRTGRGRDQTARCRRRLLLLRHHALPDRDAPPPAPRCGSSTSRPSRRTHPGLRPRPWRHRLADTVRQFPAGLQASGVDGSSLLNPRAHEGHRGVDRIMGSEICPSSSSAMKRPWRQGETARAGDREGGARRRPSEAPLFDDTYAFGGCPPGRAEVHRLGDSGGVGRDQRGRVQAAQAEKVRVRVRPPAERTGR